MVKIMKQYVLPLAIAFYSNQIYADEPQRQQDESRTFGGLETHLLPRPINSNIQPHLPRKPLLLQEEGPWIGFGTFFAIAASGSLAVYLAQHYEDNKEK